MLNYALWNLPWYYHSTLRSTTVPTLVSILTCMLTTIRYKHAIVRMLAKPCKHMLKVEQLVTVTSKLGQDESSATHLLFRRLQILFVLGPWLPFHLLHLLLGLLVLILFYVLQHQVCLHLYDAD